MSQDLFDLFSSPPVSSQPDSQTMQFNMTSPSFGMTSSNQPGSINQFGGMTSLNQSGPANQFGGITSLTQPGQTNQFGGMTSLNQLGPNNQFGGMTSLTQPGQTNQFGGVTSLNQPCQTNQFGGMTSLNQPGSTNQFGGMTSLNTDRGALSDLAGLQMATGNQTSPIINQQPAPAFGQIHQSANTNMQQNNIFGVSSPQHTPAFGQSGIGSINQPPNSIFGQLGMNVPQTQQTSPQFGQLNTAQSAPQQFGQVPGVQNSQQSMAGFGQFSNTNSVMGVSNSSAGIPIQNNAAKQQLASNLFGDLAALSPASNTKASLNRQSGADPFTQFGTPFNSPNTNPSPSQPNGDIFAAFGSTLQTPTQNQHSNPINSLSGIGTHQTDTSSDPFSGLGTFGPTSNHVTATASASTQQTTHNPFALGEDTSSKPPFSNPINNDDFFAAFSNSAPSSKQSVQPSSNAVDDTFMDAFSQSANISSNNTTPAQEHSFNSGNTADEPSKDDSFDPFGLSSTQQPNQPAAVEPMFENFSSPIVSDQAPSQESAQPQINESADVSKNANEDTTTERSDPKDNTPIALNETIKSSEAPATSEATNSQLADPVLKEIQSKFGGRWKLVRSDPYDEFLKSVGIGLVHRKRAGKGSPEQTIDVKPTGHIHVTIRSALHSQAHIFKLNEETMNLVEKVPQSVFCNYDRGKLFLQMTPADNSFGKTQEVQRFINDFGELVTIYSAGIASCRRYFAPLDQTSRVVSTPTQETNTNNELQASTPTAVPTFTQVEQTPPASITSSQPQTQATMPTPALTSPTKTPSPNITQPPTPQAAQIALPKPPTNVRAVQQPASLFLSDPTDAWSSQTSSIAADPMDAWPTQTSTTANPMDAWPTQKSTTTDLDAAFEITFPSSPAPQKPKDKSVAMTPGQLLLQNLQDDNEEEEEEEDEEEEDPNTLYFNQSSEDEDESEA